MSHVVPQLMACAAIALASGLASAAEEQRPVRVLVDRSHEWLFAHDDLAERMLRPAGFEIVLCDASLDSKLKLQDCDVVVVQQTTNAFPFSDPEIARLIEQLEAEHGTDFMPRFLELSRALKGSEAPTLQEVLYHFSLVAGTDLAPAQRQLGTTVQRPPPIAPEELQRQRSAVHHLSRDFPSELDVYVKSSK